jgi:hypothetical protein
LPQEASWLSDFRSELLSFPNGKHDDQVDAFSQLLGWIRRQFTYLEPLGSPPEVPGITHPWTDYEEGDDDDPHLMNLLDEGDVYS